MARFLRIVAAVVALVAIVNAIGFLRSLIPVYRPPGGDSMFVVMGWEILMTQLVLPLCAAAIMVGIAGVIDRLDLVSGRLDALAKLAAGQHRSSE